MSRSLSPLPLEGTSTTPETVIPKTPDDMPSWSLILDIIGSMVNTTLALFLLLPIYVLLSLQDPTTALTRISREAETHHRTPDFPWDLLRPTMFVPYPQSTELWRDEIQAMDAPPPCLEVDRTDTVTTPYMPTLTEESWQPQVPDAPIPATPTVPMLPSQSQPSLGGLNNIMFHTLCPQDHQPLRPL